MVYFFTLYILTHYKSPITVQHTFLQTRKRCFRTPFRLLYLLFTHPSHLLLHPLTDAPQEMFLHIHSIDSKLLHEIICLFQLRPQTPILSFQFLILALQALILISQVHHLFKVCLLPFTGISVPEVIDKFFCKLRLLNHFVRIFSDNC